MSKSYKRLESVREEYESLIKQTETRWILIDPENYYYDDPGFYSVSSGFWGESADEFQAFDTFDELVRYCSDNFDMRNFRSTKQV